MTIAAAVVVPAAPLLVPAIAGRAAVADAALRTEVLATVDWLLARPGGPVVLVGPALATGRLTGTWDWSGLGVDSRGRSNGASLPLGMAVGAWLLDACGVADEVTCYGVSEHASPEECEALGRRLAETADARLLVVGDGSARRTEKAPGHLDPRAEAYDRQAEQALATGSPQALLSLDAVLARELLAVGRAPWQTLAGAAAGRRWSGEVRHAAAPYGVCYLVARWHPDGD